jgi:5-methylcytosine-specific restriction endonuclease McrA
MADTLTLFEVTEKRCCHCLEVRPLTEFSRNRSLPDGRGRECRQCVRAAARHMKDPAKQVARVQAWVAANKDRRVEYRRAYYRRNAEKIKATVKAYYEANPEKWKAWTQARRARDRSAPGTATTAQIDARVAYYGGKCWMCGDPADTIDHVIPLSRGGSNWPANLRPACKSCNCSKKARKPGEL